MMRYTILLTMLLATFTCIDLLGAEPDPAAVSRDTWAHYRKAHLRNGRVVRPENGNDTVSEGQAYAMLRAVLMDDRKSLDECLSWTEANLSRRNAFGDRLLMWHYIDGREPEPAAASDADVDYAASLVLAWRKWGEPRYLDLARQVMADILRLETVAMDGRRYLSPWPLAAGEAPDPLPQNLSYYSPAAFRLFREITGDDRWQELVDTSYWLMERVQSSFDGHEGTGLVPDWCVVTRDGLVVRMPGKDAVYGWEAVRVPFRVGADWLQNRDERAFRVLKRFAGVFGQELSSAGKLCSTYHYTCTAVDSRENPMFYAAAFIASEAATPKLSSTYLGRLRAYLGQDADGLYYLSPRDYYPNSLCWLPEYYLTIVQQKNQDP